MKELSLKLNFEPSVDSAKAAAAGNKIKAALGNVELEPEIKATGKFDTSIKTLAQKTEKTFKDSGKKSGDEFGKSFNAGIEPELKKSSGLFSNFGKGIKESFKSGQEQAGAGAGMFGSLASSLGQLVSPIGLATAAMGALTAGVVATYNIGSEFETNLKGVSAVTGVTGKDLDDLGQKARDLAIKFGGDAKTQLESFQGVLSRFGPQLASAPESLAKVSENINILAKAGGLDAAASMDVLTNSMLQFGVDTSNADEAALQSSRYINVLAASAKVGAAEIPQVGEAVLVAGVSAKQANVSFEETNAAIQVLATGGKTGAEAGTALRNVLGKLAGSDVIPKEALAKLTSLGVNMDVVSDKSRPLSDRLKELSKASGDATAFAQVFGTENAAAANILASGANQIKTWTAEITGTTSATEQAATNMDTMAERVNRLKARLADFALGAFTNIAPALNKAFDFAVNFLETALSGYWAYAKEAFIKPFEDFYTVILEALEPLADLFKELFGNSSKEGIKFADVMSGIGKVVGLIINVALTPLKLAFQAVGNVIKFVTNIVKLAKDNFQQTYNSVAIFKTVVDGLGNAFRTVGGWIGQAYNYVAKFFSALGKKPQAPFGEIKKQSEATNTSVQALNTSLEQTLNAPAGDTKSEKTQKLKDMRQEIEKLRVENQNLISDNANAGIEIISEKELAILQDKHRREIEEIKRQREEYKNATDISQSEKIALMAELDKKIQLVQVVQSNERTKKLLELATKEVADERKVAESKQAMQIKLLNSQLSLIEGYDAAAINKRFQLRKALIQSNLNKEIQEVLNNDTEYSKAEQELAKLKLSGSGASTDQISAAKANLLEIQKRLLLTNEEILLLQQKSNKEDVKNARDLQNEISQLNIDSISNSALRERELSIFNARKTYNERLEIVKGNFDLEYEAFLQYQIDKQAAEQTYLDKSSGILTKSAQKLSSGFTDSLQKSLSNVRIETGGNGRVKEIEKELESVKKAYKKGELDRGEYLQKLNDLDKSRQDAVKESSENEFTIVKGLQESAAVALQGVYDSVAESLRNTISQYELTNKTIVDLETQKNSLLVQQTTDMLNSDVAAYQKHSEDIKSIEEKQIIAQQQSAEQINQIYSSLAINSGIQLGIMLAQNKSVLKSVVLSALDALQALVPIFSAQILGGSLATPQSLLTGGIAGAVQSAALIALMTTAVQVAKASVNKLNFKAGGQNPYGFGGRSGLQRSSAQINIVEDGKPEYIFNANATQKNLRHFEALNKSNMSLKDYAIRQPEIKQALMVELAKDFGLNQVEFVKELKQFNRNSAKNSKVNIDAKINVDSSRMVKEVEFRNYGETRR